MPRPIYAVAAAAATILCFVTSLTAEAKPPPRLKGKASSLEGELDMMNGNEINDAAAKSDQEIKKLKKTQSIKAMVKRQADKERREAERRRKAKAEEAARRAAAKKKAADKKRQAAAKRKAEAEAAAAPAPAPAPAPARTDNISAQGRDLSAGMPDAETIKKEAADRRKNRATRRAEQREAAKARMTKAKASKKDYMAELRLHARRKARLYRIQEVAAQLGDKDTIARVQKVMKLEQDRSERKMKAFGGNE